MKGNVCASAVEKFLKIKQVYQHTLRHIMEIQFVRTLKEELVLLIQRHASIVMK